MKSDHIHKRCAVVTGAAGGIGMAIARRFAADGISILLADINEDMVVAAAESINDSAVRVLHHAVDISVQAESVSLMQRAVKELGHIDILVNNAGILSVTPLLKIDPEEWHRVVTVNTFGTFYCLQAAAREMVRQGNGGSIINISSIIGLSGHPYLTVYGASKAAIINITRSAAKALATYRIRVNAICPGIVDTQMWDYADARYAEIEGVPVGEPRRRRIDQVPLGRSGTPEDVAGIASFFASADASYITGQAISVCGGSSLS